MAKKLIKIFYSWQSDDEETRKFIGNALDLAKEKINSNAELAYFVEVDSDTKDVVGAVDIKKVVLAKIDEADMFICDVSGVGENSKTGEQINNGNVMFELGYACGKRNVAGHILLANKETTNEKEMPFDIRNLRTKYFSPKTDKNGKRLAKDISTIVDEYANKTSGELYQTETDSLLVSIKNGNAVKSQATSVISKIYDDFITLYPGEYRNEEAEQYIQKTYEAVMQSAEVMARLYSLLLSAVEYKQFVVTECAFRELKKILDACSPKNGESYSEASFEYCDMISSDIILMILGLLTEYECWETINAMKEVSVRYRIDKKISLESLYRLRHSSNLANYKNSQLDKGTYYFPISEIEKERFIKNKEVLNAIVAGDVFMYLSNLCSSYFPKTVGILLFNTGEEYAVPFFLNKYKYKRSFDELKGACNYTDLLRDRATIWKKATQRLSYEAFHSSDLEDIFADIGIDGEAKIWNTA